MLAPFEQMALAAVVVYQGEGNVADSDCFACVFAAQIRGLRERFAASNATAASAGLPVLFVVAAPWVDAELGDAVALLRLAEIEALQVGGVCAASATDLGDAGSSGGAVPTAKKMVGVRLGLCAQRYVYGARRAVYEGPVAERVVAHPAGRNVAVELRYSEGSVGSGLQLRDEPECPVADARACGAAWELRGSDGAWRASYAAEITATNTVTVAATMPLGVTATHIRYAFAQWPLCAVYNDDGLPSLPFVAKL
eukprot:m51a1_g1044 hypothetical protein (253) ;mRNA; r:738705-739578